MLILVLQRFRLLPWLVVWGLLGLARPALATHLLGGEMTYRYLDNAGTSAAPYRYEITVVVYNNCASSILGSTAPIAIYDKATGAQVQLTAANYGGSITSGMAYFPQTSLDACTTPVVPPGCTITGNSQSYRLQKFVGIVSLPAASQGYYAYWSAFARNAGIVNILTPDSQSMTLYTMLAPPALANSSPVFVDKAVANLCVNDTTYILNNAVDPNGDRLVYAFGQPYGDGYPATFATPPPPLVPYSATQYTATTPLGTAAGNYSSINATTGIAKFRTTAALNDKFVVAVDVREYRTINGVEQLIGTTRRDVQLVVVSCPNTTAPVLSTSAPTAPTPRAYTVEAGSTLRIPFAATQADGHPLTFTASSVLLDGAGGYNATFNGSPGTLLAGNPAGSASVASAASPVAGTFVYTAGCADARATPYDLTITVKDEGCAGKTVGDVLRITVVKPTGPTAVAGTTTVCGLGTQQTYTASGGTAPTVQWTVTGGTIVGNATANPVMVRWPTAGTGTITAQGVTQYGCPVDLITKNVTVSSAPTLTIAGSQTICQGGSTTLTVAGGTAPYTLTGGAAPVSGAGPFVLSPSQTTTYTITSPASGSACAAASQVTITVSPLPAANAGPAISICAGGTGQLGAAPVAGCTYSWSPATGLSSSAVANPTVTLTNPSSAPITQAYTLTVANAAGCTSTGTVVVTVSPQPVADAGAAVSFCSGDTGQLGAAPVAGYTYSWSPAAGLSNSTIANPTVTLLTTTAASTTQTYTLTVTNAAGCTSTGTVAVAVQPLPAARAGAPVTICAGGTGQLGGAAVAGCTYSWSPATGLSSSAAANPTITLANATSAPVARTYTLTATNSSTGCINTSTVVVTVNPPLVANPGTAITLCSGGTGQLGAAPVAGSTYSWSPATGLSSSTVANPTITLANPTAATTTQTYTLTVATAMGCTSTGTVAVAVRPAVLPGTIGADQAVCVGGVPAPLTSLAAASGGPGPYDYQWELSTDSLTWKAIANVTSLSYAPSAVTATTYFRRRVAAGACGLFYTNVVTVRAQQLLIPTVALPAPPPQCAGTALTLTPVPANAGAAPTYQWFVNGAALGPGPALTSATLADGDMVQVLMTPTPGFCATGTALGTVRVSFTPVPPPTLTIKLQTALPVCQGAPISFSLDRATNLGLNPQYQWQIDGVAVRGATSPVFTSTTLRDGQVVSLVVRATTACGQPATVASGTVAVQVNPPVHVSAGPDQTIVEGESVVLQGTADGSYPVTWTPTQTLAFAGGDQLHPVATPTTTTTYVLAAGAGYCANQSPVTVTVRRRVRIPSAFTPNADNNDDTWQIAGIEDYPANHVEIFNRWGQKLFEASGYSRSTEWNGTYKGEPLPFGTYYYVVTLGNGKAYTGPLTVLR